MDPIHPIRPESKHPAPINPLGRILRSGDDPSSEQRRRGRPAKPPAPPPVDADGHLDVHV
jgi:hypothetical protein